MAKLILMIALLFFGAYLNAEKENCSQINGEWKSDKAAIERIENTTFKIQDSILPNESWMKIAQYYSCDDEYGYLIVKSEKKTFIHQDVPKAIWATLKNARSIGGYYNFYIKDKYKVKKNKSEEPVM